MPRSSLLFLVALLPFLANCFPSHPAYQPISSATIGTHYQGFEDYQLDEHTFMVSYQIYGGPFSDSQIDEWLRLAQQYALYRAGELTTNRGGRYFRVLHKDDWRNIGWSRGNKSRGPRIVLGARIVFRVLQDTPFELHDGVYEAKSLRERLVQANTGLARYEGKPIALDGGVTIKDKTRTRWRSVVRDNEPTPLTSEGLNISPFYPETKITKLNSHHFRIEMWGHDLLSPIQFLGICTKFTESQGYDAFQFDSWIDEEHVLAGEGNWAIWFRTRATVILYAEKPLDVFDAAFSVKEVKTTVDYDAIQRARRAEQDRVIDRDLRSGFIY